MTGSILKRGQTWMFRLDVPPGADGKRRQMRRSGFRTKAEASTAMADAQSGLNAGTYAVPTKETFAGFLARWLETRRPSLKPGTYANYEQLIRTHIAKDLGAIRLHDLTAETLNLFYANMLSHGRMTGGGGSLSTRMVRLCHCIIRRA